MQVTKKFYLLYFQAKVRLLQQIIPTTHQKAVLPPFSTLLLLYLPKPFDGKRKLPTCSIRIKTKLVSDLGETGTKFQSWWDRMAQKYQWESAPDGNWEINFDTKEIFLVQP